MKTKIQAEDIMANTTVTVYVKYGWRFYCGVFLMRLGAWIMGTDLIEKKDKTIQFDKDDLLVIKSPDASCEEIRHVREILKKQLHEFDSNGGHVLVIDPRYELDLLKDFYKTDNKENVFYGK